MAPRHGGSGRRRSGGLLVGTDGEDTPARRALHVDDVFVPSDPAELPARLQAAGFVDVVVDSTGDRFRFRAAVPRRSRAPMREPAVSIPPAR